MLQLVSLLGAVAILVAYGANQRGWTGPDRPAYNLLNLVGALLLLWVAVEDRRLGFILLELSWAAVTIPPLVSSVRDGGGRADPEIGAAEGDPES